MEQGTDARLRRARELYEEQRFGEAANLLLQAGDDDLSLVGFRAYLLYRDGRDDEAAQEYEALASREPAAASHRTNLGLIRLRQKRFGEAAEAFEAVLGLEPDNEKARRGLEHCRRRLDEEPEGGLLPGGEGRPTRPAAGIDGPLPFDDWACTVPLLPAQEGSGVLRAGPGGIFLPVEGKLLLNPRYLLSHRGLILFAPAWSRGGIGALLSGTGRDELVRAEGTGQIGLSGGGRELRLLRLQGGGRLNVACSALALGGPGIHAVALPGGGVPQDLGALAVRGEGLLALALAGPPAALPVGSDLPVNVRAASVAAWTGELAAERVPGPGGRTFGLRRGGRDYLRFEGEGLLLLQGTAGG